MKTKTEETAEKITMTIDTDGYPSSVSISVKAFLLAEKLQHHPTVSTSYNQVKIEISTHDAGNKVTGKDREYMQQLSALL